MTKEVIPLVKLQTGQSGVVREIKGGQQLSRRLKSLGIFLGKQITKHGAMLLWGPVTVKVNNAQISLGHGMASKIMVEVEE